MKAIKISLPDYPKIELIPLADLHLGDIHSDYLRIKETIEYIQKTPHAYCILNGDLMDCAIQSSIGDTYGANLQPMEQLKQCVKTFEPIKKKILAVLPGNHEHRIYKTDGLDITELMCHQIGIVDNRTDHREYSCHRTWRSVCQHRTWLQLCNSHQACHDLCRLCNHRSRFRSRPRS